MACLLIDVFCGPSHNHLIKFLEQAGENNTIEVITFPDKKWPWMARTGALQSLAKLPSDLTKFRTLLVTSTLNLAELTALRPQLNSITKIIYFHENQLVYPIQKNETSDFQFGYNEVISALCADKIFFNSRHNLSSFLGAIPSFLGRIPGITAASNTVGEIVAKIQEKSDVLYLPLDFSGMNISEVSAVGDNSDDICRILWSHRMEHDKDPEMFFRVLLDLKNDKEKTIPFKLVVLGQSFSEVPSEVVKMREELGDSIEFWGFIPDRADYYARVKRCDIVISTAQHEFFGLSMLEATYLGCYPVAPQRLSYPELLPPECLYRTEAQLRKQLSQLCRAGSCRVHAKRSNLSIDWTRFDWDANLCDKYKQICFT